MYYDRFNITMCMYSRCSVRYRAGVLKGGGVLNVSLVTFRWSDNLNMMRFMNFTIIFSQFELGNFGMHTVEVIQTTEAYSGSFSP